MKIGRLILDSSGNVIQIENMELDVGDFEKLLQLIEQAHQVDRLDIAAPPLRCCWKSCEKTGKLSLISLPGGSALQVGLCEKHTKEVAKLLEASIVRPPQEEPPLLPNEAEKKMIALANEKLRAKVTPAKEDKQPTLPDAA